MSEAADVHEIVIIKRVQSGHEEGHHGGVWKIAFADFMTAMMAFFLVMWLISANDKTRATIARYFNPVQLVDSTPQPKGLNDPKAGSPSVVAKTRKPLAENEQKTGTASAGEAKSDPPTDEASSHDETELFKDPYAVLAELAAKNSMAPVHNQPQAPKDGTKAGAGAVGLRAGDAYRDPFAPLAFQADVAPTTDDPATARPGTAALAAAPPQGAAPGAHPPARDAAEAHPADAAAAAGQGEGKPASGEGEAQIAALKAKLAGALKQSGGAGAAEGEPKLDVRRTNEGVLITLTDDVAFSMFASASAEPAPKMVVLMGKIGKLLKAEKGHVVVRGFTDSHPFKSDRYDNWRLSSARAHIAHYMLARGGLEDARFDRIEGYADRRPKNAKDPGGPENRRIEILLREDTP